MYLTAVQKHKYGQISAVMATLVAMIILPFLVHLIPPINGVPMGARLLPLFYAPFLAAILINGRTALLAGLLAPTLNYLIVGQPALEITFLLTIEVIVFTVAVTLMYHKWPNLILIAPLAYIAATIASFLLLAIWPLIPAPPWNYLASSISNAWPGILILLILNIILVQHVNRHNVA